MGPTRLSQRRHHIAGDLAGTARKLDDIAGRSVDAVWISPFVKSPMADPLLARWRFERLVEQAHEAPE